MLIWFYPVTQRKEKIDVAGSSRESNFSACTWATQNRDDVFVAQRHFIQSLHWNKGLQKPFGNKERRTLTLADHIFWSVWWEDAYRILGGIDNNKL